MKTILVDAWNTFITEKGINREMYEMLEEFPNPKIIVTNANEKERKEFGIIGLPYPIFSCDHDPDKTDPTYFKRLLRQHNLSLGDMLYFEHNPLAIVAATSLNITTHWYNKEKKDIQGVREFLISHLDI